LEFSQNGQASRTAKRHLLREFLLMAEKFPCCFILSFKATTAYGGGSSGGNGSGEVAVTNCHSMIQTTAVVVTSSYMTIYPLITSF